MGAGVADPERISKDVIFPNYNWPDLGKIKQQWNITTFVVLSQQMIKSIKVGKLALKTLLWVSFAALIWDVTNKWKNKTKQENKNTRRLLYNFLCTIFQPSSELQ